VSETFWLNFGRKCVRLYTLFNQTLKSFISFRLTFQQNGAHSRSRPHAHCRSELFGHNVGIHIRPIWLTDITARINEARVYSASCYVKEVCDGKIGDITCVLLTDAAYSFILGHKKLPFPVFRSYSKEIVKRIKECKLQENIKVGVRNKQIWKPCNRLFLGHNRLYRALASSFWGF
jgi:hypothetical protein